MPVHSFAQKKPPRLYLTATATAFIVLSCCCIWVVYLACMIAIDLAAGSDYEFVVRAKDNSASVDARPAASGPNRVANANGQSPAGTPWNAFYNRPTYKCRMLGKVNVSEPVVDAAESILQVPVGFQLNEAQQKKLNIKIDGAGRQVIEIRTRTTRTQTAPWHLGWPRFLRREHERWWHRYEVAKWRRTANCNPESDAAAAVYDNLAWIYVNPGDDASKVDTFPQVDTIPVPKDKQFLTFCEDEYTRGEVMVLEDVVISGTGPFTHSCGPNAYVEQLLLNGASAMYAGETPVDITQLSAGADTIFFGDMPASWIYQHWIQNNMPKIARAALFEQALLTSPIAVDLQAAHATRYGMKPPSSNATDVHPDFQGTRFTALRGSTGVDSVQLSRRPKVVEIQELILDRYPIIKSLHDHIGWAVVDKRDQPIHTPRLVYSCKNPPLSPSALQLAQVTVLGVEPKPIAERNRIVYCGRTSKGRVENKGRRVTNEQQLLDALQATAKQRGWTVDEFDQYAFKTIAELVDYFSRARVLIGPHGGCLTNVVFMPCNSVVLELFPLVEGKKPPVGHAGMMMYMQSTFLEMSYWMLPIATALESGDIDVPIDDVKDILNTALAATDEF